jgi:hypothetical protein
MGGVFRAFQETSSTPGFQGFNVFGTTFTFIIGSCFLTSCIIRFSYRRRCAVRFSPFLATTISETVRAYMHACKQALILGSLALSLYDYRSHTPALLAHKTKWLIWEECPVEGKSWCSVSFLNLPYDMRRSLYTILQPTNSYIYIFARHWDLAAC